MFVRLHELTDPSRAASKNLNRLMRSAGAAGGRREVLHSLRGDRIDENRDQVSERTNRLQVGHGLQGEHDRSYGRPMLRPPEMRQLYELTIPDTVDLSPFHDLDLDVLAQRRPRTA